jgi:predicted phage terminase large subunit-like protein
VTPARQIAYDDPQEELRALVLSMTPERLAAFCAHLDDDDLAVVEGIVAGVMTESWRSSPDAMAHFLTNGAVKRWRYVRLICEHFVEAVRGIDTRKVINMPSQMGKTTWLCTYGVPWALQEDPTRRIMYITYDDPKAREEGAKARDFIEEHPELGVELRRDRRAANIWRTPQGGGLKAVGIHGGITGWPMDTVICDDLIKGWDTAHSEAKRDAVWNIYRTQVRMRLQGSHSGIIIGGTRWHEDDPSGRALDPPDDEFADRWTLVRLPAIAEPFDPNSDDPLLRTPDPLGRAPGEILEPERFDETEVRARASALGSYLAAGLEQQRPSAEQGNELLRAWFRIEETMPVRPDEAITSWDLKMKDREAGDYVVGQCWWRTGGSYWMTDQIRGQYDHATTACGIALLAVRHPEVRTHLVEAAGSADEVIPQLRDAKPDYVVSDEVANRLGMNAEERAAVQVLRRRGMSGLLPRQPTGDKRVRARAYIAPIAEAGDVYLPAGRPWLGALLNELAAFPNGANDDQVDAMSQALKRLTKTPSSIAVSKTRLPGPKAGAPRRGGTSGRVVRLPGR